MGWICDVVKVKGAGGAKQGRRYERDGVEGISERKTGGMYT